MYLSNVRLSYCHLATPRPAPDGKGDPKFSATLIIPKDHPQIAEIRAAAKAAVEKKFGSNPPRGMRHPLRDGDELDQDGQRLRGPEFAGMNYINASSVTKPEITVGSSHRAPRGADELRSGNYADVQIAIAGYDKGGNKGVTCYLNAVWIKRRGEPLGFAPEPWKKDDSAEDFDAQVADKANAAANSGAQAGDEFA